MRIFLTIISIFLSSLSVAHSQILKHDDITFKVFKTLRELDPFSNFAYSPLLLHSALNFIYENSNGTLKSELESFNNITNLPKETKVLKYKFDFSYSENLSLKKNRIKTCGFDFKKTSFDNPFELFTIELFSIFDSKWENKFDEKLTEKRTFGNKKYGVSEVDFMKGDFQINYSSNSSFRYVSLPFADERYEMFLFKPKANFTLDDFSIAVYLEALKDFSHPRVHVTISLPKFEISSVINFIPILKGLDICRLFEFSNEYNFFEEDIKIKCQQFSSLTKVSISENGVKAFSLMSMSFVTLGSNQTEEIPIVFDLDEPFIYVIVDRQFSQILYIGQIVNLK